MFGSSLGGGADVVTTVAELAGVGQYVGGLERMSRAWGQVEVSQSRASRVGGAMQGIGAGLTIGVTGAEIALLTKATKLGMDAIEAESLFKVSFGNMAGDVEEWSKRTSKALGLNEYALRRQAATFKGLFDGAGFDGSKAAQMSMQLSEMRDDITSFFNVDTDTAQQNLLSGLAGETEPLRKYGIFLTEATLQQYAYAKGIAKAGEELSEQQKIAARFGFIQDNLRKRSITGDLERTKDSPSNRIRSAQAQLQMEMTKLGLAAMPLLTDALDLGSKILPPIKQAVEWFSKLDETTRKWVLGIVGAAGPLLFITGKITSLIGSMRSAGRGIAGGVAGKVAEAAMEKSVTMMIVKAGVVNVNGGVGVKGGAGGYGTGLPMGRPGVPSPTLPPAAPMPWWKQPYGPQFSARGGALGLRGATMGSAIGGAVVGVAAGAGVRDDMKTLGFGEGAASGTAIAAGLSAAALTAFNPAAGVLLAAGTALRYGVNEFYNKPFEREAEAGTGADNAERYGKDAAGNLKKAQDEVAKGGDRRRLADQFSELSTKAAMAGDETTAKSYALEAMTQRRRAKKEADSSTPEFWAAQRKRSEAWLKENPLKQGPVEGPVEGGDKGIISNDDPHRRKTFFSRYLRSQVSEGALSVGQARGMQADFDKKESKAKVRPNAWTSETRQIAQNFGLPTGSMGDEAFDGSNTLTVKIPPRRADADHRATRFANNTPLPPRP